ncbi:hypothetical protein JW851_03740 [Candidatus Woesearchaeota archaeon]|nr:hypothetical protein [Candidatus Woesearchaeota archaeon]
MNKTYTPESMRKLNEEVYNTGIPVKLKNPYDISSETALNRLERKLFNYSKQFGEDAAFVEWGQPFGGPSNGFRAHKSIDVIELQKAYRQTKANGVYPKAGSIIDKLWIDKKRKYLGISSKEFNLNHFFNRVLVKRI